MRSALGSSSGSLLWTPLLCIAAAAAAVEVPFIFHGIPSGHDVEFHLYTWLEVLSQWRQGTFYPRWAALAHFAYGEPRFVFYPPASWTLGALLAAIFPWTYVSAIYIWLALTAAGTSMFLVARHWLSRRDATLAAMLYAVCPYHLVIVYWRSAFAELLASCLLPCLLFGVLRSAEHPRRGAVFLGVLLAAAWLINAPAAVMIHYSMALLLLLMAWWQRSPRILLTGVVAVILGAALAAFYLVPAVYEQKWVNISQAVSPGARPLDNFLFSRTDDAEHNVFNQLISWTVVAELVLTAIGFWAARRWQGRDRRIWILLGLWAAACTLLMFSISNPLWDLLPKLRFMQFPWRWTLCVGVPFSLLAAIGVKKWPARIGLYAASLCVIAFVWHHYQAPWWDTSADLREMQDNIYTGAGYQGTDEYTPAGVDPSTLDDNNIEGNVDGKNTRRVTVQGSAQAAIHVSEWNAQDKLFTAEMSASDRLALHLFNYPAWQVEVNGNRVQAQTNEDTGQMLVPVTAGENRVHIVFTRTLDRTLGGWISLAAIAFVALASRRPRQNLDPNKVP